MTIDPNEADALLRDIASSERRTREMLTSARAGYYMIMWGALWAIGFTLTHFMGSRAQLIWIALDIAGLAGSSLITYRTTRALDETQAANLIWRPLVGTVALICFGFLWVWLVHATPREQDAFWPTFMGTLLFVFGLWGGRVFCATGALIVALTMIGYFWTNIWFELWLGLVCGSTLIALGLWLRR
jgi:hypothetical protein